MEILHLQGMWKLSIRGQFHQPFGAKCKCISSNCFVQADIMLHHSDSPTKSHPTLPRNTTRSYAQLLCLTICAICQLNQCKSTGGDDTADHWMLMKWTSWVDFTNMFILMSKDPICANIQSSDQCLFALFGSAIVKAVCKTLVK
jgi:hypothetical protein